MELMTYRYTNGLCCWDADKGSRKEATFVSEYGVRNGYGSQAPNPEDYAAKWAIAAWELGSSRVAIYRVAVSNGKETQVFKIKVDSRPVVDVELSRKQTIVDLDTMSKEGQ